MMPKTARITWVVGGLIGFTIASILYFNSVLSPSGMDQINSNAGTPTENQAAPYVAQFKADCVLADGQEIIGTVSVPANSAPDQLETIEIRPEGGQPVTFRKDQLRCVYAPY